jgi:hypothetical protein
MSYMVSIEGSQAPTVIHPTYQSAQMEAERLSKQPRNQQRIIHVLKLVSSLKPVTTHKWEHREQPLTNGQIGAEILMREFARHEKGSDF